METHILDRRRMLTFGAASAGALALGGCVFGRTGNVNVDAVITNLEDIVTRAQQAALQACSTVIPTAATLSGIILAIVGSYAGLPTEVGAIVGLANQAAKAFCDAITQKLQAGVRPKLTGKAASLRDVGGLRGAVSPGVPIISYGPANIRGKYVDIQVLARG